jgi:hypothetical protein
MPGHSGDSFAAPLTQAATSHTTSEFRYTTMRLWAGARVQLLFYFKFDSAPRKLHPRNRPNWQIVRFVLIRRPDIAAIVSLWRRSRLAFFRCQICQRTSENFAVPVPVHSSHKVRY